MQYENQEMIDRADMVAKDIVARKGKEYVEDIQLGVIKREPFFAAMIDAMGFKYGAEIGVDKGQFSLSILNDSKIERLYCVDTWQDDFGSDFRPGFFDPKGDNRYKEALGILKPHIESERAYPMRMTSLEASNFMPNGSLDYCYIDGDHSMEGIYSDLKAWLPKVKVGGIISGHDYKDGKNSGIKDYFGEQLPYKIKTVCDGYCQRYGHAIRQVGHAVKSWWFIKNRETEDQVKLYLLQAPEKI